MVADFNRDGIADAVSLVNGCIPGEQCFFTRVWDWLSKPSGEVNLFGDIPAQTSDMSLSRVTPAGIGDFDGDGLPDIAIFYRYDDESTALFLWYDYFRTDRQVYWFTPSIPAWSSKGWDGSRVIPAGVSKAVLPAGALPTALTTGDLNRDGIEDIAAFYRYEGDTTGLWVWYGSPSRNSAPNLIWKSQGWEADRIMPVGISDVNGDGVVDVTAFYRYDNERTGLWAWYGQGNGLVAPPAQAWASEGWDAGHIMPAGISSAGAPDRDMNADGRADIAAFYRYDDGRLSLFEWRGQPDGTVAFPWATWTSTGWEADRLIPAGVGRLRGVAGERPYAWYIYSPYEGRISGFAGSFRSALYAGFGPLPWFDVEIHVGTSLVSPEQILHF
jgi:hypothetical protein